MAIKKITRALLDPSLIGEIDNKLSASTAAGTYRDKAVKINLDDLSAEVRSSLLNGQNIVGYDDSLLRNRIITCENIVTSFGGVDDFFRKGSDKVSESMFDSALTAKLNAGIGSNDYLATGIAELQSLKADKTALVSYRAKLDPIVEADLGVNLTNKINAGPSELQTRMTNVENDKADKAYVDGNFRNKADAIDQASLTTGLSSRIDYSYNKCVELEPQVDALIADVANLKTTGGGGSTTGFATTGELNDFKSAVVAQYVPLATYSPEIETKMAKAANLSDVADVSVARHNLGMYNATYKFRVAAHDMDTQVLAFGPVGDENIPVENCMWQVLTKDKSASIYGLPATGVGALESDNCQIMVTNETDIDKDVQLKVMLMSMPRNTSAYGFIAWQNNKFVVYSLADMTSQEIAAADLEGSRYLVYNENCTKITLIDYQPQNCSNIVKLTNVLTGITTTVTLPFADVDNSTIHELSAFYDGDNLKWCCFVTSQVGHTPTENDVWQDYGIYSAAAIYEYENNTLINTVNYVANGLNVVRDEIEDLVCSEGFVTITPNLPAFVNGESNDLIITTGCATAGNITVTADDVSRTIAVNPTDHGTAAALCAKIVAENWGTWSTEVQNSTHASFGRQAMDEVNPVFSVDFGSTGAAGAWNPANYPTGYEIQQTYEAAIPKAHISSSQVTFTLKDLWTKKVYIEQRLSVNVLVRSKMLQNDTTQYDNLITTSTGTIHYADEFTGAIRKNIIKNISINSYNQTNNINNVTQAAGSYIYHIQNGTYNVACAGKSNTYDGSTTYLATEIKTFANGFKVTADGSKVMISKDKWSYDATALAGSINISAVNMIGNAPKNGVILDMYGDVTDRLYLINRTTNATVLTADCTWVANYDMPAIPVDKATIKQILEGRQQ